MTTYRLPYGKRELTFSLPERAGWTVELLAPRELPAAAHPAAVIDAALDAAPLPDRAGPVVIAVNDKTRPVPHAILLPPCCNVWRRAGSPRQTSPC